MTVSKKQYQDLLDRVNSLERTVAEMIRGERETTEDKEPEKEKQPFEQTKREWMLFEDERKGGAA